MDVRRPKELKPGRRTDRGNLAAFVPDPPLAILGLPVCDGFVDIRLPLDIVVPDREPLGALGQLSQARKIVKQIGPVEGAPAGRTVITSDGRVIQVGTS